MVLGHTPRTGWLGGSVMLAMLAVLLTGCSLQLWSKSFDVSTSGRTPASFAADCAEKRGTLSEIDETGQMGAESKCTVSNGDTINCMWTLQICFVDCFTSDTVCTASVEFMGYVPPGLSGTPVASAPAPTDPVAFRYAPLLRPAGTVWS
jgi:hypothetical protein